MNTKKTFIRGALLCAVISGVWGVVLGAAPAPAPSAPAPAAPAQPGAAAGGAAPAAPVAPADGAPARGRRGGGGGGAARGPALVVNPLPDAVTVEKVPPLDKNGNYVIAPPWTNAPELTVKEGVPKGTVTMFELKSEESKFYTQGRGGAGSFVRQCWVYVPAGYVPGTELPLMVNHDGRANSVIQSSLVPIMDNLIAEKRIPMMGGVFVAAGPQRAEEYDRVSRKFADYLEAEVIPEAEKVGKVKFTKDPDKRGTIGQSSGGAAALSEAWFRNDLYHRVISYSGTFVMVPPITSDEFPQGAWAYHAKLIPESERKHIRIWMQVGSRDNGFGDAESGYRNWPLANNRTADALKAKGYDYQYVWSVDAGHVEAGVERQTLAQAMEWVWKGDKVK